MNPKLTRIRATILLLAALAILFVLLTRHARAQATPPAAGSQGAPATTSQAPGAPTAAFTLHGAVVDPAGKPVADQRLTLHRVDAAGGAMVDSATSDAQGRFLVHVPAERDTGAVFFVATRWQGQLYIGAPFKPPVPGGVAYSVVVGVNPVNMGPAGGDAAGGAEAGAGGAAGAAAAPSDTGTVARWFLAVILALVALGAIAYALLGAARERDRERRRELLARIAALDERAERAAGDEATRLERERAELLAELSSD